MAKIPNFEDDLNIIASLGDTPGSDNGLSASALKAKFDAAGLAIQKFLNNHVVPAINNYIASNDGFLKTEGGTMLGNLVMSFNRITNLGDPLEERDAVNKKYADKLLPKDGSAAMTGPLTIVEPTKSEHAASKGYVDNKHLLAHLSLPAASWEGDAAPYSQAVDISGFLSSDIPHCSLSYSGDASAWDAEDEAWSMVKDVEKADGAITFICFEEKPDVDLSVVLEVNR